MSYSIQSIRKVDVESFTEVVTTAEVKAQARITFTDDDTYIGTLIPQVREAFETYCNITLIKKTVTAITETNCGGKFLLPYGPIDEITSASISGTALTVDDNYILQGDYFLGYPSGVYTIVYTAGYGYTAVPGDIKLALLQLIAYCYEHRGDAEMKMEEGLRLFASKHVVLWK